MKLHRVALRGVFTALSFLLLGEALRAGPVDSQGKPLIEKLGTVAAFCETTPIVLHDRLYRFQWNRTQQYFEFVDLQTGEKLPPFAFDNDLGSAFVANDTVYVSGVPEGTRNQVKIWTSTDLRTWSAPYVALNLPDWTVFNTSLCKADGKYVMMFEVGSPTLEAGVPFTARFATSTDLVHWTLLPREYNYSRDRYTAPHALRYLDGYYYNFYLEDRPGNLYETCVVRSKDLMNWESSPLNPVLTPSADDRKIYETVYTDLTPTDRQGITTANNWNNSDIDFTEYNGELIIFYNWGDQLSTGYTGQAVYRGTEAEFLHGWFGESVPEPGAGAMAAATLFTVLGVYSLRRCRKFVAGRTRRLEEQHKR